MTVQGDNDELETILVSTYFRRKGVLSTYIQPYHPEQNEMPREHIPYQMTFTNSMYSQRSCPTYFAFTYNGKATAVKTVV